MTGAKPRALLAYLALTEEASAAREHVAALLWPEADAARAHAALRQCVRALRFSLEAAALSEILSIGRETLRLDLDRVAVDAREALLAAEAGWPHPALLLGRDPFATLFRNALPSRSAAFERWLAGRRSDMARRAALGLARALEAGEADPAETRDRAAALLALDPLDERAARGLMRAFVALGEEARALETYDGLWRRLDEARDAEPSPETRALAAEIANTADMAFPEPALLSAPAAPQEASAAPILSLLPFDAPAEARATAALARLHLAARLGAERAWRLELAEAPPRAGWRLEGALAPEGPRRWRLSAAILDAGGRVAAGAAVAAGPGDWGAALDGAAARLAAGLLLALDPAGAPDAALLPAEATARRAARARALVEGLGPDALIRALDLAEAAGEPAPAAEALAARLLERAAREGRGPSRVEAEALAETAERAVAADPLDAGARRALGWARLHAAEDGMEDGAKDGAAAQDFALAAALHPTDAAGLLDAALGLALAGARREAEAALEAAGALVPAASPAAILRRALALAALGREEAAGALAEAAPRRPALAGLAAAGAAPEPEVVRRLFGLGRPAAGEGGAE